jgi:hypothetical protein
MEAFDKKTKLPVLQKALFDFDYNSRIQMFRKLTGLP